MWKHGYVTTAPASVILIRLLVGAVFLSEGIQKFLFPDQLGVGRLLKIGLPSPEILGPFVGGFEMLFGTLVLMGLLTRLAVIPLLAIMAVALTTTKWPILVNQGFWAMAHEARTDCSMTLDALCLWLVGRWIMVGGRMPRISVPRESASCGLRDLSSSFRCPPAASRPSPGLLLAVC